MTATDTSTELQPPRLLVSKLLCGLLCLYAAVYAFILVNIIVTEARSINTLGTTMFAGMLCLAATPFLAFIQLRRVTLDNPERQVRPILMAFVMAAPAVFWLGMALDDLGTTMRNFDDVVLVFWLAGIPGLLSLWLVIVFGWIAYQRPRRA